MDNGRTGTRFTALVGVGTMVALETPLVQSVLHLALVRSTHPESETSYQNHERIYSFAQVKYMRNNSKLTSVKLQSVQVVLLPHVSLSLMFASHSHQ